jgi:predicted Fe-Mo cluster-binding NifX family protein
MDVLSASGIKVFAGQDGSAGDAVRAYQNGELTPTTTATTGVHGGMGGRGMGRGMGRGQGGRYGSG